MKTTIQVINAQTVLKELGIPLYKRFRTHKQKNGKLVFFDNTDANKGVKVRAQRFRRVFKKENGSREIFYEFGSAIGKMYDKGTMNLILEKEASLLMKGVNIKYYRIDGEIVAAELEFSYGQGEVRFIGN